MCVCVCVDERGGGAGEGAGGLGKEKQRCSWPPKTYFVRVYRAVFVFVLFLGFLMGFPPLYMCVCVSNVVCLHVCAQGIGGRGA